MDYDTSFFLYGIVFIIMGIIFIIGAAKEWHSFMNDKKAKALRKLFGKKAPKIFFMANGIFFFITGTILVIAF